jgi:hypothetical protein
LRIAARQSSESSFVLTPSTRSIAKSTSPDAAPSVSIRRITSSPYVPATYAQNAWPQRYGKYFGLFNSSIEGSESLPGFLLS